MNKHILLIAALVILPIIACGGSQTAQPLSTSAPIPPTPLPTNTPPSPPSTPTPIPPLPTDTPIPPPVPTPTSIPPPPTDTPVPPPAPTPTPIPPPPTDTPPPPAEAQLVIITVNKEAEYVDIQNAGGAPQDLAGWRLLSEKGNQDCALAGVIQPGEILRIWATSEDADKGGYNCGFDSPVWNNKESDPAVLFDATGREVDRR
jgi:hypothetical protein